MVPDELMTFLLCIKKANTSTNAGAAKHVFYQLSDYHGSRSNTEAALPQAAQKQRGSTGEKGSTHTGTRQTYLLLAAGR